MITSPLEKYPLFNLLAFIFIFVLWESCTSTPTPNGSLPDPLEAGWEGRKVCEVLEDNEKMRILKCTFEPGVGHEKHYHDPHFGYTIKGGKFQIKDEGGTRVAEIPDGYTFKNERIEHEVMNIGATTSVYLIIESK